MIIAKIEDSVPRQKKILFMFLLFKHSHMIAFIEICDYGGCGLEIDRFHTGFEAMDTLALKS